MTAQAMVRLLICTLVVLAITALRFAIHIEDTRLLSAALNVFLIAVLAVAIRWGTRYAIVLSLLSGFAFSWSLPPAGHLHWSDPRVWTLLTACLVTGIVAGQLSARARKEALQANQRRAEAVVAQQRFEDLVNSLEGIVWEADAEPFKYSFVSKQAEQILGYPTERWLQEPDFRKNHIHPEDRDWAAQPCLQSTGEEWNHDFEYRMIAADGRAVWLRDLATAVIEDGRATRLRGVMVDITKRWEAEETVRHREKEIRDVIETIPAVAWSAFPDGTNAYVNKHWTEYTGLSAEQTAGSGWQTTIHPDDIQRHLAMWRECISTGKPFEIEVRLRRSDGQYRWHLIHGLPLRDDRGQIVKWYGISTDIEDRKRAEIALHAAINERTRLAAFREQIGTALSRQEDLKGMLHRCADAMVWQLDAAFARIWTLSSDGKVLELQASTGMYTHLDGRHSRIPIGQLKIGLIAQERKPYLTNDVQNDPRVSDKEWARREKMISFAGYPLVLEDRIVGVMGMFSRKALNESTLEALSFAAGNIAQRIERKRAEDALRRSEAYLAEAQKLTNTGSFALNPTNERVVYWSEETFRIFGFDPGEGVPPRQTFFERIHVDDRRRVSENMANARHRKADFTDEFRIVLPGGEVRHIHVSGHPVFSASGELIEIVGTQVDVTDRKRAEEEHERLRQLEADLAHINRVTTLGELTASLAHEVNQPIAAAVTNASTCVRWLAGENPNIEEARQAARRIVKDANRAAEIITRLRQLFKKSAPQRERVDLKEVINEMVVLLRNEATRHGVTIRSELAADLPAVMGDRIQLQQVLMNLMINGIDAMKGVDGSRELLLISERDSQNQLLISVSDTGIGLPPNIDEIFDAFFTTKPQGTGMGLAISRSIVESHGGRLSAKANPSRGATFHFSIPVSDEAEP